MTPLYNRLSRYLPPPLAGVCLALIYALLLLLVVTFLLPPTQLDFIYLDLGR